MPEELTLFHLTHLIIGVVNVKMDRFALEEKSVLKVLEFSLSSKFYWDSYIVSIAKTITKKIGALIRSMKFLSR